MRNFFGEAIDWIGGAVSTVGTAAGDVAEFVAGLPGEIRGIADRMADAQREASAPARDAAIEYRTTQLFGAYGLPILIGAGVITVLWLSDK